MLIVCCVNKFLYLLCLIFIINIFSAFIYSIYKTISTYKHLTIFNSLYSLHCHIFRISHTYAYNMYCLFCVLLLYHFPNFSSTVSVFLRSRNYNKYTVGIFAGSLLFIKATSLTRFLCYKIFNIIFLYFFYVSFV